jgi:hypothetical protein
MSLWPRLLLRRRPSPSVGVTHVFTALTAVRPFHASQLGRELRVLAPAQGSPLAQLRYLQLGRWVVIDQLKSDWIGLPRRMPTLKSAYLLFTATVTVPETDADYRFPGSLLANMRTDMGAAADKVWSHCWGYPGSQAPADFDRYFVESRILTGMHHFDYGDATVETVRDALQVHAKFASFAQTNQGQVGVKLQDAYLKASRSWPS